MNTATATKVLIGKCKRCNTLTRVERELFEGSSFPVGGYHIDCANCGRWINDTKTAKQSAIKCGAKCYNATGPSCSCECGGKNHGGH
jgi:hypothetical protein